MSTLQAQAPEAGARTVSLSRREERQVVVASTLGTLFEWYDFFIYGALAVFMSQVLFPQDNPTVSLLAALGALAVGFVIRPLGAVLFGYLGDRLGRKHTFLITVVMMGGATVLIGCLPTYDRVGRIDKSAIIAILVPMTAVVAMVYGPVAAFLVELFPARIRYTALSFPYHIGAGIFGGIVPFTATYLAQASGNVFGGLMYPVLVTAIVAVLGSLLLPNTQATAIDEDAV